MKGFKIKGMLLGLACVLAMSAGCFWVDDGSSSDGGGGDDYCCYYDPPAPVVYEYWYECGPGWNTLEVGDACECGGCAPTTCTDCCTFSDYDSSWDTVELTSLDEDIVDLQFNFTLTNWGYETTHAWVMLCDDIGCEAVVELDLYPGDVYWDRVPNPVLDTLLDDYYDCLWLWGDLCWFDYDVEVYVGEECTCSPVTLDYYYEGLYVY